MEYRELRFHKTVCVAKLESGELVSYDLAHDASKLDDLYLVNFLASGRYEYLGRGVIWTVDGVLQNDTRVDAFWRLNDVKSA